MPSEPFDLAIIGGGVNGCGVARDAAGRGLSVYLCEQNDLASGTSSWSTKLIHGGLRYLEHYEFRLVREALIERETLWRIAPHIIRPLRFVLPYTDGLRPAWLLRMGLFLYDHLGGRKLLPPTRTLDLTKDEAGKPLRPGFRRAFEFSDCAVQDTRLVVLNAMDARERGAIIETRTRLVGATRDDEGWTLGLSGEDGVKTVRARALVNAAGPWVADVLANRIRVNAADKIRLVQGSHIVVRKLYEHDRCYMFQNADGRIVFAIPFDGDTTLIGTTDRDYTGEPGDVAITGEEIDYLCEAASEYFAQPVTREQIVWTFSGVRPLYDDGASKAQELTRDYVLRLDDAVPGAPMLSIFGGKITTYRKLAEAVLDELREFLPERSYGRAGWTATEALPGGNFAPDRFDEELTAFQRRYPFLARDEARRIFGAYGLAADAWLGDARSADDLGERFPCSVTEAELSYLVEREFARTGDDVLWRRSRLGLRADAEEAGRLDRAIARGRRDFALRRSVA